jgi:hypothetical protein
MGYNYYLFLLTYLTITLTVNLHTMLLIRLSKNEDLPLYLFSLHEALTLQRDSITPIFIRYSSLNITFLAPNYHIHILFWHPFNKYKSMPILYIITMNGPYKLIDLH